MEGMIVDLVATAVPDLSPLGAGIIAAAHLGIAKDSRSFARKLDLAHALVLRECTQLEGEAGFIFLDDRSHRSQRVFYDLTEAARALVQLVDGS